MVSEYDEFHEVYSKVRNILSSNTNPEIDDLLAKFDDCCDGILTKARLVDDVIRRASHAKIALRKSLHFTRCLLRAEVQERREAERTKEDMRRLYNRLVESIKNSVNISDEAKQELDEYINLNPCASPLHIDIEKKYNNFLDKFPAEVKSQKLFASSKVDYFSPGPTIFNSTADNSKSTNISLIGSSIPENSTCDQTQVSMSNTAMGQKNQLMSPKFMEVLSVRRPFMMYRRHYFTTKLFLIGSNCVQCSDKIRFGSNALQCRNCPIRCHEECRYLLETSCVPYVINLSDFSKLLDDDVRARDMPMVPAPLVHCINEIEKREFRDTGMYCIGGDEKEVRRLKRKFLRDKSVPCLSIVNTHVLASFVKDFLRGMRDSIIPNNMWNEISVAMENYNKIEGRAQLDDIILRMPRPNRDTLAFVMLHLKHLAENKETQMSNEKLIRIFGPLIVGFSSIEPQPNTRAVLSELFIQFTLMKSFMAKPKEFWLRNFNNESDV